MSAELLEHMQAHLNMERQSAAAYFATAIWFAERELVEFATTARRRQSRTTACCAVRRLPDFPRPNRSARHDRTSCQQWSNTEAVISDVFRMEADVTSSVLQLYKTAEQDNDMRTTVFLDPIVEGQRLSEHEAAYLLGRVKFAANQPAALLLIDAELREKAAAPATLAG